MKLSSALGIPMEQLITLTVEKPQMHGGKPTDRTYLEKNLPASLDKALREYIQGEKDKVSYMDCLCVAARARWQTARVPCQI